MTSLDVPEAILRMVPLPPVYMLLEEADLFHAAARTLEKRLRKTGHFVKTSSFHRPPQVSSTPRTLHFDVFDRLTAIVGKLFSHDVYLFTGQTSWIQE
ncbi:hypothetical protein A1O1_07981 [Capronia coronata CBS 617.96]|uniref:Uncharacterized protein n=1 Tax=Capronia coronata CBS 617.96 TaxID=1182541 RepID=W9YI06_9EURO|nr:uncharacterized protein A1O1_07981 [Capronia coronata CBS 617.96]EXJ81914.1 hypothetical protein A1O1_07981 [Capronia coronata CBS 617.96]